MSASSAAILRRADVALLPLLVMSGGSFALAISQALRPLATEHGHEASTLTIPASLLFGVCTAAFAYIQTRGRGVEIRNSFWVYLVYSAILLIALAVAGLLDRGVATVAFTGVLLMAPYVSFVFPWFWSRVSVVAILATVVLVHVARPDAKLVEAATIFVLVIVGWSVGLIPRNGHGIAFGRAQLLSRSDQLTRGLNRRGFLEQLEYELAADRADHQTALLILDLNGFKLVNDQQGHAAGDEILAWVGQTVAPRAAFGRLGGDEFAVLLPGADGDSAAEVAAELQRVVTPRIGLSIGVATTPLGPTSPEALLHAADLALYSAKATPNDRIQFRVAAISAATTFEPAVSRVVEPPPPAVTYAALRAAGGPPRSRAGAVRFDGRWMLAGFGAMAAGGAFIVISTIATGGHSFYEEVVRYGGIPWVLVCLGLGLGYRKQVLEMANPMHVPFFGSSLLVGVGVGTAALAAGGGAISPIVAGLYLKVMFDSATFGRRHALQQSSIILVCWILVLILGPGDALWAAPFGATMIVGAFFLGSIGRRAFDEATRSRLTLANTDELTSLYNRGGFETRAERAMLRSVTEATTFAVIALDLDDFKSVNDTLGHAAGDRLLRSVAAVLRGALPDAFVTGRVGGDEFMAALPLTSAAELAATVARLDAELATVTSGSVGGAILGADGSSLDALMRVADHRAYAVKQARQEERASGSR